jgi:hypothetical protein
MSDIEYDDKMFPAATHADQEAIMAGEAGEPTVLGTVPFSSPEPHTDGLRMLPLEDGTSAHQASIESAEIRDANTDPYKGMKNAELKRLVSERGLEAEGNKNADLLAALRADDADGMLASDFIARVNAATNQEELDAAASLYEAQDRELSTVEAAIEKKQEALDNPEEN